MDAVLICRKYNEPLFDTKADIDGANMIDKLSGSAKGYFTNLGFPGNKYIDLVYTGKDAVAPANGYVCIVANGAPGVQINAINKTVGLQNAATFSDRQTGVGVTIEISKGDTYQLWCNGSSISCRFVYAKGEI